MADRDRSPAASPGPTSRRSLVSSVRAVGDSFRERLYLGIPWGTLLLCVLLVAVYALVQGGADTWSRPVVVPFTSWSYHHPLGVLVGPLAHQGPSHLLENLAGVLVFGSAAELLVGHYPNREREPGKLRLPPLVRALVGFPALAILAGVLASAFSWGPTIGFSNVVFVFAGIVLVRYPLGAVVALVAREALVVLGRAMTEPLIVAGRSSPAPPWFADTAVQTHSVGLLCGVAVGTWLLVRREVDPPSSLRLWTGTALFAIGGSLWALWWPAGGGYVLARAPGIVFVGLLATLVTLGSVVATRGLPPGGLQWGPESGGDQGPESGGDQGPESGGDQGPESGGDQGPESDGARGPASRLERESARRGTPSREARGRQVGFAVLLVPLAVAAGIAVPLNAAASATVPAGAGTVDVGGYAVTYAEDVPNQRLAPFASVTGDRPTTSGVLVVHQQRGIWTRVVPARALARDGTATVRLGGLGWDRRVFAVRRAWRTAGGDVAAAVWLNPADGGFHRVYATSPARVGAVVDGYTVVVRPGDVGFRLRVRRDNRTVGTVPMPDRGENETVGHLTLRRSADRLVAVGNRTRVPLAHHD